MKGSLDKQASKEIILPCIRAVGATTSLKGWTKFCPGIWPFCWISKPNLPTLKQLFIYFFLSLLIFHYKKSSFFVSLPHPQLSFSTFINLSRRGKKKKNPQGSLWRTMEALKTVSASTRFFAFALWLLFASALLSLVHAKTHEHEFVVSIPILFLVLLNYSYHFFTLFSLSILISIWNNNGIDSSNTSEEAVQNPQQHHSQRAIPWPNLGNK